MIRLTLLVFISLALGCAPEPDPTVDAGPAVEVEPTQPDIYLARLVPGPNGPTLAEIENVTDRAGYDNQPHFTPDGSALLYTSQRNGQTDIYRFTLADRTTDQLTSTPESEYSATVMPGGETFSVIQVEADSTQRLWSFDFAGENRGVILTDVKPVGYHAWAGPEAVAMFVLPVDSLGITLHLANPRSGTDQVITTSIGRSLNPIPGRATISFVDKSGASWTINALDPATGATSFIAETVSGSEDHAWTPGGAIIMGNGSVLHIWQTDGGWTELADLEDRGISNITRLAVHPTGEWIAVVADGR